MALRLCECGCGVPTKQTRITRLGRGGLRAGDWQRFIRGHAARKAQVIGYRGAPMHPGKRLHVLRAEMALGRPLPKGAVVHHADGSTADDAPLVICQDQGYHKLLHSRMKVKAAGGNPNTDSWCSCCKRPRPADLFTFRLTGRGAGSRVNVCRDCNRLKARALKALRKKAA